MSRVEEIYLVLLRAALYHEEAKVTEQSADWLSVLHLAARQGTAALIAEQLLVMPNLHLDKSFIMQLKAICAQTMMEHERQKQVLRKTWKALQDGGVMPVLMKGFGLAKLYPKPYLRQWGDLDVYVGPQQYHRAAALLRDAFPDAKHHDEEWEELKHYNFVLSEGGVIEMHRTTVKMELPLDQCIYYTLETEGMTNGPSEVKIEDIRLEVPEYRFNVLFTFLHAWYHFTEEGLGMKQVCDVALLVGQGKECRMELEQYLKPALAKLSLMEAWHIMGYLIVKTLLIPKEEWPLYDESERTKRLGERFLHRVLEEGCDRKGYVAARRLAQGEDVDTTTRYERREEALQMNILKRKWITLMQRMDECREIYPYSPQYARHMLAIAIYRGIRRTVRREKMEVMY